MSHDHRRADGLTESVGRRTFLRVLGSAAPEAAVAACSPVEPERIIPYVIPPEDSIPGVSTWYASVCGECPAGCGTLVRTREGRAVKIEGNPAHPINQGNLCVRGQAALQGLYSPDRFTGPRVRRSTHEATGESVLDEADWESAQTQLVTQLRAAIDTRQPGRVAIVTPLLTGTLDALVDTWAEAVGARRFRYEPFAYEAIRAASQRTFGENAIPTYDFRSPDLVVSFGADFQETWLSTVGHTRDHADARRPRDGQKARFIQLEPRMSLTAANADEWVEIEPGTEGLVAAAMIGVIISEGRVQADDLSADDVAQISELVRDYGVDDIAVQTGVTADRLRELARGFSNPAAGPGRTLAVGSGVAGSGENATADQVAINLLNHVAGNIGRTVRFGPDAAWARASSYRDLTALTETMRSGEIDVLLVHDVNLVHTMPGSADFAGALDAVGFVVATSSHRDETSARSDLVLPTHTPLESWGDVEPVTGIRGLMQPAMRPLFDTKHLGDLLLETGRSLGDDVATAFSRRGDFFDLLQDRWEDLQPPPPVTTASADPAGDEAAASPDFDDFWATAQRHGGTFHAVEPRTVRLDPGLFAEGLGRSATESERALALVVYPSLHFYDGRGANRSWLQEIPDPLLKTTWGTWVEASPATVRSLGAADGQLIHLESNHGTLDVTLLTNAQIRDGVVAVPLGQGHTDYGRFANHGVNANLLLDPTPETASGGRRWLGTRVDATPLDVFRPVAQLQHSFDQDGRGVAQSVTLAALAAGDVHPEPLHLSLHEDHEHPVHRWGMAVDLDSCNGCNACVAACYAENNVPVMGADAMRRGRTMSWIRIERFVEPPRRGDAGIDNRFLPMMCQHCDHAPCETVCPTFATYHTDEGLNAQIYNRCVGTRYCANNCPYKVRRFNWSNQQFPEPLNLQLNPDVTSRTAGVMEKCTFCVQRIHGAKDTAYDEDRPVQDGDVTPACAQTCPTHSIVFGDLNDPESRVSQLSDDPRSYRVFDVVNTRPAVTYLKKVTRT